MRQFIFSLILSAFSFSAHAQVMDFYQKPVPVPNLVWQTPKGEDVSMAHFKGKVVLLNLWATWCKPCQIEMPAFNFLQKRYKQGGFEVVAVAINDTPEKVSAFIHQNRLDYIAPYGDGHQMVGRAFAPKAMPTSYLINRKGEVIAGKAGLSDWLSAEMMNLIESELRKAQAPFELPKGMQVIDRNDIHGGIRF